MNIKSKFAAAVAVATLAATLAIPTSAAQARGGLGPRRRRLGARDRRRARLPTARAYGGYYVDGYRRCRWERQYDALRLLSSAP